jgi:hypothetical protein
VALAVQPCQQHWRGSATLQQLRLSTTVDAWAIPCSCLSGVAQLSHLTSLQLAGEWSERMRPLQLLLAQPLPLLQLHLDMFDLLVLDTSGLTQLTQLVVGDLPEGSKLPNQLQHLHLLAMRGTSILEPAMRQQQLQQIQHLAFYVGSASLASDMADEPAPSDEQQQQRGAVDTALLLRVGALPKLRSLQLEYLAPKVAAATAAAWRQLPQLDNLDMSFRIGYPIEQQMTAILAGVAAATSLTKLHLHVCVRDDGNRYARHALHDTVACASLSSLTRLKDLTICEESVLAPGDALALTALTGLTRLVLVGAETGVTYEIAAALARSLSQLQHLELKDCPVGSDECFDAIGQLTELRVTGFGDAERDVRRLTGLTNL